MKPIVDKYLPLETNSSLSTQLAAQRKKDHYSHFILRLAFSSTEDLRRRFTRVETILFRLRFNTDDLRERVAFIQGLQLDWEMVTDEEKTALASELGAVSTLGHGGRRPQAPDDESWCKVNWDRVPELVEGRRVFIRGGKAYVPSREQASMVVAEFSSRLERALEVCIPCLHWQQGRNTEAANSTRPVELAHGTRPTSPRRRRPLDAHSKPPLQKLCHAGCFVCKQQLRAARRRNQRPKHRQLSHGALPSVHAEPAPVSAA